MTHASRTAMSEPRTAATPDEMDDVTQLFDGLDAWWGGHG